MPDSNQVIRNYRMFNGSRRESAAEGEVTAGDLIERVGDAAQSQSTDGEVLDEVLVATDARGRGYVAGDNYASGTTMPYANCNAGDLMHLRLDAGESVTGPEDGSPTRLVAAGNGAVRAFNADSDGAVVAVADETLDNSGGADPTILSTEVTR